jgi:predicted RNA-binding protein with TRAM domain
VDEAKGGRGEKPFKRFETPKPVAIGDEVDVTIESVGGQGDGIAKVSGFVVFVKGAKKDERIRIKITDLKRTYALGEKVGEASEAPAPGAAPAAGAEQESAMEEEAEGEAGEEEEEG